MSSLRIAMFLVLVTFGVPLASASVKGEAMWSAACNGDLATVQKSLAAGVPVDYQGFGGYTSLLCAAIKGHLNVVKYLVEHKADVNKHDNSHDKTPLLAASFAHHLDVVTYLVERHADPNIQGINGWTAMHDAGYVGKLDIVKELATHGASRTIKNELGETALQTTTRAHNMCVSKVPHCPTTEGLTDATVADYKAVIAYLSSGQSPIQ